MGWIRERILSEKKKHESYADWALIAENKIRASLRERIHEINTYNAIEEDDCILIKDLDDALVLEDEE